MNKALLILVLITVALTALNTYLLASVEMPNQEEQVLEITLIQPDCPECTDLSEIPTALAEQQGKELELEVIPLAEAEELVEKYDIKKAPAIIVKGAELPELRQAEDAQVFDMPPPPYVNTSTGKTEGLVKVTHLVADCEQCTDVSRITQQLSNAGIAIQEEETLPASSPEGKKIIQQFNITKVPTLLFSEDMLLYPDVAAVWETVGTVEQGKAIMREVPPPYLELDTGKIKGLVEITKIVDEECQECYNISNHETILQQSFNVHFVKEETIAAGSARGRRLLREYNLTKVPTMLLSEEAQDYPGLISAWEEVGTIEEDGTLVLRNIQLIGTYKNTETGEVITE